jgi:vesicular inhibitory amino acid transporter
MKNSVSERSFLIESDDEDAAAAVEDGNRRGRGGEESGDDDVSGSDSSSPCDSPRVVAARCSQPSSYTQQWPQSYR